MAYIGLFAAFVAVLSQIAIPMPFGVPITLQTFAVALSGYYLGWKRGLCAIGVYLLIGAVGAPVFANFGGGAAKLAGVTGGFLFGFLPMVALCGLRRKGRLVQWGWGLLGLAVCHLLGVAQFALISGNHLGASFLLVSLQYLPKDVLSVVLAQLLARRLLNRLPQKWLG